MPYRNAWIPAVVAALVGAWGITVPSLWRDESVSGMVALLPLDRMRALLGDLDAVHGLYYLLLRPFVAIGVPSELALRLPSLIAFVAAAYGVAVIGDRLAGQPAGLFCGLVYALLPIASRYAQEARSYALVSAAAVLATWLLVELLDRERPSWWWYAGYAASLALLGWLHLYALLLVPAHAVAAWRILPRWLAAVAAAGVALLPLVLVAAGQREVQVWWLKPPGLTDLAAFPVEVAGGAAAAVLVLGLALYGARRGALIAAWAFLPVAASFAISQVEPIYHARYVLFVVPGIALAAGIGLADLARRTRLATAGLAGLAVLAVLAYGTQAEIRRTDSRPDDLRTLATTLDAELRPGDAVLFVPQRYRLFTGIYGEPYGRLVDVTAKDQRLQGYRRVWLVSPWIGARYRDDERLRALRRVMKAGEQRRFGDVYLTLYQSS